MIAKVTVMRNKSYLGTQFTLKISSKPSSKLGSTYRDLEDKPSKTDGICISNEHITFDTSMMPPILVEEGLLDFCVSGVCQLSEYIVVPKKKCR